MLRGTALAVSPGRPSSATAVTVNWSESQRGPLAGRPPATRSCLTLKHRASQIVLFCSFLNTTQFYTYKLPQPKHLSHPPATHGHLPFPTPPSTPGCAVSPMLCLSQVKCHLPGTCHFLPCVPRALCSHLHCIFTPLHSG